MCSPSPGVRCASDTRGKAATTRATYTGAYPVGPDLNPLAAAGAAYTQSPQERHAAGSDGSLAGLMKRVDRERAAQARGRTAFASGAQLSAQVSERLWARDAAGI